MKETIRQKCINNLEDLINAFKETNNTSAGFTATGYIEALYDAEIITVVEHDEYMKRLI